MTQTPSRRNRTRKVWRKANAELFAQVGLIIERLRDYWPLTLRQVHYQAVAAGIIPNHLKAYKRLSGPLSDARFMGYLVWECMEDRSRSRLSFLEGRRTQT